MSEHEHFDSSTFDPDNCWACEHEYRESVNRRIAALQKKSNTEVMIDAVLIQKCAQSEGYILSDTDAEAYVREFWV